MSKLGKELEPASPLPAKRGEGQGEGTGGRKSTRARFETGLVLAISLAFLSCGRTLPWFFTQPCIFETDCLLFICQPDKFGYIPAE